MQKLVDVQAIIDAAVIKRSQSRGAMRDSGKFHVSDAGTCYRKRYLKRLGVEPIVPIPTASLRKMLAGDAGHDMLQGLLRYSGDLFASEQEVGNQDIKGHHDGIVKPTYGPEKVLLEFKTIEKWAMTHITGSCSCQGDKAHPYGPKPEHKLQMFTYWAFLRNEYIGLNQTSLIYVKREDFGAKQFDFVWSNDIRDQVAAEWAPLLHHWDTKTLPPCTCHKDYGGNGISYCRYKNEDGTECCDANLVNTLNGDGLRGENHERQTSERSSSDTPDGKRPPTTS